MKVSTREDKSSQKKQSPSLFKTTDLHQQEGEKAKILTSKENKKKMDFTMTLPEECQSLIISFTSPADACRSAIVCRALGSAVDFDAVWERFLPCDYKSIILGSSSSSSTLLSLGKKELYLQLCFDPILLQNGTMSFQLEKGSGKKCYMLGARALSIIWGDTPAYWNWTFQPDSRFPENAVLVEVWWLKVTGTMETKMLSSNTNYAVYLVFRLRETDATGFRGRTVGLQVSVDGIALPEVRRVSLDPLDNPHRVRERRDGWMEVEMGEFFNERGDDGTVEFCMKDIDTNYRKRGLIIEGIELRPKAIGSYVNNGHGSQ